MRSTHARGGKRKWPCFLLWLAACGNTNFPPEELPPELTTCEVDADCAAYELGCCDSCNGGLRAAMRADLTEEEVDPYRERCGRRFVCTQVGCEVPEPACDAGACVLVFPTP
jgi:hypothetical protein